MIRKYISIIMLATMLVLVTALAQTSYAEHPDKCLTCHGPNTNTQDTIDGTQYSVWDHQIFTGVQIWDGTTTNYGCLSCHNNYVAGTAHAGVGCRCHAVLHIGKQDSSNIVHTYVVTYEASDTYTTAANVGGLTKYGRSWIFDLTATNPTDVQSNEPVPTNIATMAKNLGEMDVEVGLWNAFDNDIIPITTNGGYGIDGSAGTGSWWTVCFNCHFLAGDNPSQVGAFKFVDGKWKIGIPESALSLPPHEITGVEVVSASGEAGGVPLAPAVLTMGLGLLGLGLVFVRKK